MSDPTYAAWVQPIADVLAKDAEDLVAFARGATPEFWEVPSPVAGWANRDILAHLSGGNDQMVQKVLRATTSGAALDPGALEPDTDGDNACGVRARQGWTIPALIEELARGRDEMMELLSQLSATDESVHPGGARYTVGDLMRIVAHERHDHVHLEQMRSSVE
jgi:uncharacterized protein (TIGR03083 family)